MENLQLNYQELAFIMDIKSAEAKDIFLTLTQSENVKTSDLLSVEVLKNSFKSVKSLDERYDGQNELLFNLKMKPTSYKDYLSDKANIKKKAFSGGQTVFYKILSKEQLAHAESVFDSHWNFMYGKNK